MTFPQKNEHEGLGISKRADQVTIMEEDAIDVPNKVIFLATTVRINGGGGLMIIGADLTTFEVSCVIFFDLVVMCLILAASTNLMHGLNL